MPLIHVELSLYGFLIWTGLCSLVNWQERACSQSEHRNLRRSLDLIRTRLKETSITVVIHQIPHVSLLPFPPLSPQIKRDWLCRAISHSSSCISGYLNWNPNSRERKKKKRRRKLVHNATPSVRVKASGHNRCTEHCWAGAYPFTGYVSAALY